MKLLTRIVLIDQFVTLPLLQILSCKFSKLPFWHINNRKSNHFYNGNIYYFKIVNYMEIYKWQIKSFVYWQRLMGVDRLRIYVIMLPSSDFSVTDYI